MRTIWLRIRTQKCLFRSLFLSNDSRAFLLGENREVSGFSNADTCCCYLEPSCADKTCHLTLPQLRRLIIALLLISSQGKKLPRWRFLMMLKLGVGHASIPLLTCPFEG